MRCIKCRKKEVERAVKHRVRIEKERIRAEEEKICTEKEREIYRQLMECARYIVKTIDGKGKANSSSHKRQCLLELVYAILRPLQSELFLHFLEGGGMIECDFFEPCVMDFMRGQRSEKNELEFNASKHALCLNKDAIFACTWDSGKYLDALCSYGDCRTPKWELWKQQNQEGKPQCDRHDIILWLPWCIAKVGANGNHSIAAGISSSICAPLKPDRIYDMSFILDLIEVDERVWCYRNKETNKIIGEIKSGHRAAAFEIGHLIKEYENAT